MPQIKDCKVLIVNASSSGDNTLLAAPGPGSAAGNIGGPNIGSIFVWQVAVVGAGAVVLQFKSGASTNVGGPITFTGAGSAATLQYTGAPWFKTVPGQDLVLNLSAGVAVTGTCYYTVE